MSEVSINFEMHVIIKLNFNYAKKPHISVNKEFYNTRTYALYAFSVAYNDSVMFVLLDIFQSTESKYCYV